MGCWRHGSGGGGGGRCGDGLGRSGRDSIDFGLRLFFSAELFSRRASIVGRSISVYLTGMCDSVSVPWRCIDEDREGIIDEFFVEAVVSNI